MFATQYTEILPNLDDYKGDEVKLLKPYKDYLDRYDSVRCILGNDGLKKLRSTKLFMVGVGAIGCELLKNYAMLGLGTQ